MAGNRKINNQEQLASVRAKLNDNFEEISDVTTQLQPLTAITGGGRDGFTRANADGTFDTIKTAPPDGGVGDNHETQNQSEFSGKLPDSIIIHDQGGNATVATFYAIQGSIIMYVAWIGANSGSNYWATFTNDDAGSSATMQDAAAGSWSFISGATSLQQIIDNGHAVYHGQKSGTGGVGSLSMIKTLANKSANGNFYTELPDAIIAQMTTADLDYYLVAYLDLIKPNSTAGVGSSVAWEVIYRPTNLDTSIRFNLDSNGTLQRITGFGENTTPTATATSNLRWYVENGQVLYFGGQQDYGVKAWGKFDGTNTGNLSFTGGNIQSVVRNGSGSYTVTFNNPMPHADYSISGSAAGAGNSGTRFGHGTMTAQSFDIDTRSGVTPYDCDSITFQIVC
jgi:hypothetical protein